MTVFRTRSTILAGALGLALAFSPELVAHRLDEYLQATRIAVSPDSVQLEIDLTPGVAVASSVLASIDTDRDDRISLEEADTYASAFVRQIVLLQDGVPQLVTLERSRFPSVTAIGSGTGTIHLEATTPAASVAGMHRLSFRNNHRHEAGVYLVNALVPASGRITIDSQRRDPLQREIELDYSVVSSTRALVRPIERAVLPLGLLVLAGVALAMRSLTEPDVKR